MIRLGVATRILGHERLSRAGVYQSETGAHLSVRLLWVIEALRYLDAHAIRFYRLPDNLLAPEDHAGTPLEQMAAAAAMLDEVGAYARSASIRLGIHPHPGATPGAVSEEAATRALAHIGSQVALLDALGAGPESVVVVHIGGEGGDCAAAAERFAIRFERMPPVVRRRVAIEPDGERFGLFAALRLHRFTGIPVVFDAFHFQLRNPERLGLSEALGLALATWSPDVRPEVHFSTQRTEAHLRRVGQGVPQVIAPRAGQHSDFVNPFEFVAFLNAARGLPPFDVMLEAKAADLALLRLRDDLRRYAPEYVGWVA
ncbi:MAG: UV damage endonuclease UvsE [Roseiflexus sp.]